MSLHNKSPSWLRWNFHAGSSDPSCDDDVRRINATCVAVLLASFAPMVLALNQPPSPTLLSECTTFFAWAIALAIGSSLKAASGWPPTRLLHAAVGACAVGVAAAAATHLPAAFALSAGAGLLVFAWVAYLGASLRPPASSHCCAAFLAGLCLAGVLSALIGVAQVYFPDVLDGALMARSSYPGRAVGNLRQPNHLSSLLLWAQIALVGLSGVTHLRARWIAAITVLLVWCLVLTASRTGMLGTLLLAIWGLIDRRLPPSARWSLVASPLLYLGFWMSASTLAHVTGAPFGGEGRLSLGSGGDISSSRFAIWSNALSMIAREPWTGVGFGEFNLAWTLTELPNRPTAFFDHTHNFVLQLWVEMGIPLGSLVVVLLLLALVQAGRRAWACDGGEGVARRAAFMVVLTIGLHSMLEYPLWYAYFLLPTAFAWGYALSSPVTTTHAHTVGLARPSWVFRVAGVALAVNAAAAAFDYGKVVAIYDPPDDATPLQERISRGQRSLLYGHHADYAAATAFGEPKAPLSPAQQLAFRRAPHQLLDVRLMIAWSQALAAEGRLDEARWLAARIREFKNPSSDAFFEPCSGSLGVSTPLFQCQRPSRQMTWRDFLQR